MTRTTKFAISAVTCVLAMFGCGEQSTAPAANKATQISASIYGEAPCSDFAIICDENGGDPGSNEQGYFLDYDVVDGSSFGEFLLSEAQAAAFTNTGVSCPPGFSMLGVPATLFPPNEAPLPIASSGWWGIIFGEMSDPYGRYNWPSNLAHPELQYMWPALDQSRRRAQIMNADARCVLLPPRPGTQEYRLQVTFYKYNGVRLWYPTRNTGGGGSGGGGWSCTQQFAILEINYGDGTGWHELWRGYVTVCG